MRRALAMLVVAFSMFGLGACGSSNKPAAPPPPPTDLRGKAAVEVDATGNQFQPASIIIDAGTKVTWRNADPVAHNVKKSADVANFGAPFGIDADKFGPGATYSFTFRKPGKHFYTCTIHTLMNGDVDVRAKG